jgi:hypothetical protein
LGTCTALLLSASVAFATERRVPSGYSTIQGAVDASAEGDVVLCAAGTYTEAVAATKSRVTIQGAAGAVWDGGTGASVKDCVKLTGDYNVVTGFKFKNGFDQCKLVGKYCEVRNCVSEDAGRTFCWVEGERAKASNCVSDRAKGVAVYLKGAYSTCTTVTVRDCEDVGSRVEGDDCNVRYNRYERCKKGGHHGRGNRHECHDNESYDCDEFGFKWECDSSLAYYNWAERCGSAEGGGYVLIGSDNELTYCDTYECKPHGHRWKGHRNWCYDNWSDYSEEDGFNCEGDDNDSEYNQARWCGRDGHNTRGNRNRHYECDSYDNDDDGFDCESGTDNNYRNCTGKRNGGAGCENGGSSTDLYSCVFLYNTVDIGLDGTLGASFGTLSLNLFGSGSILTVLSIGLGL